MVCPTCGEVNEGGYQFCRVCGHPLGGEQDVSRTTGTARKGGGVGTVPSVTSVAAPPGTAFRLVATSGLLSGRTFSITSKGLMVGRDQTKCQIDLPDDQISRQHAWVGLNDAGEVLLRDHDSSNGSYINQVRVKEGILKANDQVSFGASDKHLFRLESYVPAPVAVPAHRAAVDSEEGHATSV